MKPAVVRKCDLSNIPKIPKNHESAFDWKKSIGQIVPFEYDGIKDSFMIVGFESRDKVYVRYKEKQHMLYGKYIKKGKIAKIFDPVIEWKYKEGDIIQDHVRTHDRHIQITKRKYVDICPNPNSRLHKYYQYKCLICGYDCAMDDFWVNEADLKDGKGCGCCAGTKVIIGINDIPTTFPEAVAYIDDKSYLYKYTKTSQKKTMMTCPYCGFKKISSVDKLYFQSFGCPKCSDGYSYPEKFFFSILEQAEIKFKYQLGKFDFEWCDKYKYDFYLPDFNAIIEINGKQHYDNAWHSYERQHQTDIIKKELALKHGIKLYIEIDCSNSEKDYITQSLIKSNLPFSLDNVDFALCDAAAQKNRLRDTCKKFKNNPDILIRELATIEQISEATCRTYLKKGYELGLCPYPFKRKRKKKVS